MAITANAVTNNTAVRDKAVAVANGFQRLVQNSSAYTAADITALQAKVTALQTALTTAGAI